MAETWVGRSPARREDPELLMGRGKYLADITRPSMLHAVFLRSPYAHARIGAIDVTAARMLPGVRAVMTAGDLPADLPPQPCSHMFGQRDTPYYALAPERVRYAGEPVTMIVAESQYIAEDARDLVEVEWDDLPGVGDVERALEEDAPRLYEDWPDNVAGTFETEMGDVDEALSQADVVVTERFRIQRQFACPLETRGVLAEWGPHDDELILWTSTQIPHIARDFLGDVLGLPEHRIRVLTPRVGGAFGCKFHFYPEEVAVAFAAKATSRPVRWVEDRLESFTATVHAREQIIDATMAARKDGTITAVTAEIVGDMGAALHTVGYGPLWLTSVMMTNAYEIPNARVRARAVVTNKTPLGSYRGWGQPQANFAVERLLERVALSLEMDANDVRRINFVRPDNFPYKSLHHVFDSGRYADCLNRALELADVDAWRERQTLMRSAGRYVGIGVSFFVENTALGPSRLLNEGGVEQGGYDISRVRMDTDGGVAVYTGLSEMGQGFTSGLAQICADTLGLDIEAVTVVSGDTNSCPYTGYGTGASRSAAVGGAAVRKASTVLREKILTIAGHMLEVSVDDLEIKSGQISVKGSRSRFVTMRDVGRAAYLRPVELPEGVDPGLEATEAFDPPQMAWSNGTNVAVVEVDVETGQVTFLDYGFVHDCGTMLNPMIVEGQIHGGVAQGIGSALYEELAYDESGQPQFGTFMDYVLPTACEVPRMRLGHQETPSPIIPGGVKGVGEAGAIGSPAAVVNAIEDALRPFGVKITETPVTPTRIVVLIDAANAVPSAERPA